MDLHMRQRTRTSVASLCGGAVLLWVAVTATTIYPAVVIAQEGGGRRLGRHLHKGAGRPWEAGVRAELRSLP